MINVNLKESNRTVDFSFITKAPIVIENQLDTSLDSGTLNYLIDESDNKGLNEPLAGYSINIGDKQFDFVGMDSRALLCKNVTRTTVISVSPIETVEEKPLGYRHTASGTVEVSGENVVILSVSGNIMRTYPIAKYSNGEITWSVTWTSRLGTSSNYVATIVYTSSNGSIYSHQVALTEPSKLLQGVMIDGFGVTQPEDYGSRKSLLEVVNRLLAVTPFDCLRFILTNDSNVTSALKSVVSPEFKWNTQTTLWECLLQVGAVIDAIPRLAAYGSGNYIVVTFDFVNAYVDEVDSLDDGATNALGENVDEIQYNTALSSVVENLREN